MPIHDWTRVSAGDFHDFHQGWTVELRTRLNQGVLPAGYYAQVEQRASGTIPNVLTLQYGDANERSWNESELNGAIAIAEAPPQVQMVLDLERRIYSERKNVVVVRHLSDNRIVAMIEVVSSGNKASDKELRRFVDKSVAAIDQGIHLLIVDLYPPTERDPQGVHALIWAELGEENASAAKSKPLTLASYWAASVPRAYVDEASVGDRLNSMPLFLTLEHYVAVPLEEAYQTAFSGSPPHVKRELA